MPFGRENRHMLLRCRRKIVEYGIHGSRNTCKVDHADSHVDRGFDVLGKVHIVIILRYFRSPGIRRLAVPDGKQTRPAGLAPGKIAAMVSQCRNPRQAERNLRVKRRRNDRLCTALA